MKSKACIRDLFTLAAAMKSSKEWAMVDEVFVDTIDEGIPDGVRVVYLFADRDEPPALLEEASHFDVFGLEFEGQEQAMPVPILVQKDAQLAQSLFAAAEFRPREDLVDTNDYTDEDDGDYETDGWSNLLEV